MKTILKYTFLTLVFFGVFFSCFQLTLIQVSKITDGTGAIILIDNIEDDTEEDGNEPEKNENEYCSILFNCTFHELESTNTNLLIKELNKQISPFITINIPPPKI